MVCEKIPACRVYFKKIFETRMTAYNCFFCVDMILNTSVLVQHLHVGGQNSFGEIVQHLHVGGQNSFGE